MASRWRQNVYDIGMSDGPYDLIAGFVGFPGAYLANVAGAIPRSYDVLNFPSAFGNLAVIVASGVSFGPINFPFGFNVEPDS